MSGNVALIQVLAERLKTLALWGNPPFYFQPSLPGICFADHSNKLWNTVIISPSFGLCLLHIELRV